MNNLVEEGGRLSHAGGVNFNLVFRRGLLGVLFSLMFGALFFLSINPGYAAVDTKKPPSVDTAPSTLGDKYAQPGAPDSAAVVNPGQTPSPSTPSPGGNQNGSGGVGSPPRYNWNCWSDRVINVPPRYPVNRHNCWAPTSTSGSYAWSQSEINAGRRGRVTGTIPMSAVTALGNRCAPSRSGDYAGFRWVHTYWKHINSRHTSRSEVQITCVRHPSRVVDVKCYNTTTARFEKVTPNRRTLHPTSGNGVINIRGTGPNEYERCLNVRSAAVSIPALTLNEFGRYQSTLKINYTPKRFKVYNRNPISGAYRDPVLSSTGSPVTISKFSYAQVTCNPSQTKVGMNRGSTWTGSWKWDMTDCDAGGSNSVQPYQYQCVYSGSNQINGVNATKATIFRDGEKNKVDWAKPSIKASTSGTINTQTMFERKGTPWNTPKAMAKANNNVRLFNPAGTSLFNSDSGSGWRTGIIDKTNLTATWASEEGKPTVITPSYKWSGNFRSKVVVVTGINPMTAQLRTTTRTVNVASQAICKGSPMSLSIVRSGASID